MNYFFARYIQKFLQNVFFELSFVRQWRTVCNKKRPPIRTAFFRYYILFYNGKNKSHKNFGEINGFSFRNKSGITLTVSHIFDFCPAGSNRMTAFKLAAIIVKRNVREHKIKSFHLKWGTRIFLAANKFISELSVHREHYIATKLANQGFTTEKTDEKIPQKLCKLHKNENSVDF